MKTFIKAAVIVIATTLVGTSFAGNGGGKSGAKGSGGRVTAVTADSITIKSKKDGEMTFKTAAGTKVVKTDGSAGKLTDVLVGAFVKVTPGSAADKAEMITLVEKKKKMDDAAGAAKDEADKGEADNGGAAAAVTPASQSPDPGQ